MAMVNSKLPLWIEPATFSAVACGGTIEVSWTTESETNNAGFEIHYLMDDFGTFELLAFVKGAGTTFEPQHYRFRTRPLPLGLHRFQLRQIDCDGGFEYSQIVEAALEPANTRCLSVAVPNTFRERTQFTLQVAETQSVRVYVYNAQGRRVQVVFEGELSAGTARELSFDAGSLPAGVYVIRAEGARFEATRTVVKQP